MSFSPSKAADSSHQRTSHAATAPGHFGSKTGKGFPLPLEDGQVHDRRRHDPATNVHVSQLSPAPSQIGASIKNLTVCCKTNTHDAFSQRRLLSITTKSHGETLNANDRSNPNDPSCLRTRLQRVCGKCAPFAGGRPRGLHHYEHDRRKSTEGWSGPTRIDRDLPEGSLANHL